MNTIVNVTKPVELLKIVATAGAPERITSGSITSISRVSGTKCLATTSAAHGLYSGARVHIIGAVEAEFDPDTQRDFVAANVDATNDEITLADGVPFKNGTQVFITNSGGAAPAGITAGTLYWAKKVGVNLISLYTDAAMASIVNITGAGTGTQTLHVIEDGVLITVETPTTFSFHVEGDTALATGTITYYADIPFRRAVLQAKNGYQSNNTDTIYIGVQSANGEQSTAMAAGAVGMFEKTDIIQNLADFWIDVAADGDGVLVGYI